MPEESGELRGNEWRTAWPILRLFATTQRAVQFQQMVLALACVFACYGVGRLLDGLWGGAGVVMAVDSGPRHEIEAFAWHPGGGFEAWVQATTRQQRETARQAAMDLADGTAQEKETRLKKERPERLLAGGTFGKQRDEALALIEQRLKDTLAAVTADGQRSAEDKREATDRLEKAADLLRLHLTGKGGIRTGNADQSNALHTLTTSQPAADEAATAKLRAALSRADALTTVSSYRQGIFITLLSYEMDCFAAAVQGAARGKWLFGDAGGREPSMLGSIGAAGSGVLWLVTQRPVFALVYGVFHLGLFALFGLAICRSAAIQTARGEGTSVADMLGFARGKAPSCVLALLTPVALGLIIALLLVIGGVLGAIPIVGPLLAALFYFLAILGGAALAAMVVLGVMGVHLVVPRMAVEGSDGFDGGMYAVSYATSRGWHLGLYALVLLIYGAASFIVMRIIALLTLKMAHVFTAAGMSWFGAWASDATASVGRLDALWRMPAWNELSLLPTVGGVPFWGEFATAPLGGAEWLACLLLRLWVFLVVGLLGAFVVSFYFVGSLNMYLLLRKTVDGVDYDELYYEEVDDSFFGPPEGGPEAKGTASLPVISPQG